MLGGVRGSGVVCGWLGQTLSAYITTINCMQQLLAMTFTLAVAVAVAVPATALSALLPLPQLPSLLLSQDALTTLIFTLCTWRAELALLCCLLNYFFNYF